MTLISSIGIVPSQRGNGRAPNHLDLSELSIVVPVKNNQSGVHRLLTACLDIFTPQCCPKEILLVDNLSHPPLVIPQLASWGFPLQVLTCSRPGPAAARNLGARIATGNWVLFFDSDCVPTQSLIEGYRRALNGAIAYAGVVRAEEHDPLSRYYETQGILAPPPLWDQGVERPVYLITANALVWRPALAQVGGFDERFPEAGGEDIDLGLRLWRVGPLAYAPQAQMLHTFEPHLPPFIHRFVRYGRANRLLSTHYQVDLAPRPFAPRVRTLRHRVFAGLQFLALWWGYVTVLPKRSWSVPLVEIPWSDDHPQEQTISLQEVQESPSTEVAVFVDGDNISADRLDAIWQIVSSWGPIRSCRVYCARPSIKWELARRSYPLILVPAKEGSDTDTLLAADADAYTQMTVIRRFCLVTNDGDFATLARRLGQMSEVLGVGLAHASRRFKQACTRFVVLPQVPSQSHHKVIKSQ